MSAPADEVKARQRALILAMLREGPVSTLDARSRAVMSPASRVAELRGAGWHISTERRLSADAHGRLTRCGVYVLRGEPCPGS